MPTLYATLQQAYYDYLKYLQEGNSPIALPYRGPEPSKSGLTVRASSLGRCPLAIALERSKSPMKFPPTQARELSSLHLMQQGTRDAAPFQEAMLWKFGECAQVEIMVESEALRVRGRIDVILTVEGRGHIVEIKRRDAQRGTSGPAPKLSDVYQAMVYGLITGAESVNILILNRYFFNLWNLRPVGSGYVLVDEKGDLWNSDLNAPEHLNHDNLRAEIARHLAYLDGGVTSDPMPDFINRDEGWQCFQWENGERPKRYKREYKGKTERTETIVPRCPFWCHTDSPGPFEVHDNGDNTYTVDLH